MKIILTGATGFVGGEVLEQLLQDESVSQVIVLTRSALKRSHLKLKEIIIKDFLDLNSIKNDLEADACIWCLGVSQTQVTQNEYIKITFDYTINAATLMLAENPKLRFCFLSGSRADQEEKSTILYAKIKGRTERELSKLSANAFHFRPAFIKPSNKNQRRPLIPRLFVPIAWVVDHFTENFSVKVDVLARSLIDVAKNGAPKNGKNIFDNQTISHRNN